MDSANPATCPARHVTPEASTHVFPAEPQPSSTPTRSAALVQLVRPWITSVTAFKLHVTTPVPLALGQPTINAPPAKHSQTSTQP